MEYDNFAIKECLLFYRNTAEGTESEKAIRNIVTVEGEVGLVFLSDKPFPISPS